MRNNGFKDCLTLFYIEFLKSKNRLIDSFQNPLTTIKSLVKFALPLALIIFSFYSRFNRKAKNIPKINTNIQVNTIGAIVIILLFLIVLLSLNSAVEKYNPTEFSVSDVNYLFPSPINPRTLYAFTILKKSLFGILMGLFTIMYVYFIGYDFFALQSNKIIYVLVAFFLISIIRKSMVFLIYSLSTRFHIGSFLKILVKGFTILLVIYFIFSLRGTKNIYVRAVGVLNDSFFSSIPIISWAKDMIISPITSVNNLTVQTLLLLLTTILMLFFAVFFADNYYEEASVSTEHYQKIRDLAKKNLRDDIQNLPNNEKSKKKKQRIDLDVSGNFKGATAFIWKQALISKRTKGTVFLSWTNILTLGLGLIIGFALKDSKFTNVAILYCAGFFGVATIAPSVLSPLKTELRKQYIFLLPGRARSKILSVYSITAITTLINCILATISVCVFAKHISVLDMFSVCSALVATLYTIFLSVLIFTLLMPTYDDGKNTIFIYIIDAIILSPAIITVVLSEVFITKSMQANLFIYSGTLVLVIIALILLSDWLFSKIELLT
jgi:hypothetical protein